MLRESVEAADATVDLRAVVDARVESGVPQGALLARFATALVRRSPELTALRERIRAELGEEALVEAAGAVANFQRMTRIADGIGIPLDEWMAEASADIRADLDLGRFASSANTPGG